MISRHNRVDTLFFATAEFIFDDWHRFLGVVVDDWKTQEGGKVFSSFWIIIVLLWMSWLYKWWWCARIIVIILID